MRAVTAKQTTKICIILITITQFLQISLVKRLFSEEVFKYTKSFNLVSVSVLGVFHQKGCVKYPYIVKESIPTVWKVFLISMITLVLKMHRYKFVDPLIEPSLSLVEHEISPLENIKVNTNHN